MEHLQKIAYFAGGELHVEIASWLPDGWIASQTETGFLFRLPDGRQVAYTFEEIEAMFTATVQKAFADGRL